MNVTIRPLALALLGALALWTAPAKAVPLDPIVFGEQPRASGADFRVNRGDDLNAVAGGVTFDAMQGFDYLTRTGNNDDFVTFTFSTAFDIILEFVGTPTTQFLDFELTDAATSTTLRSAAFNADSVLPVILFANVAPGTYEFRVDRAVSGGSGTASADTAFRSVTAVPLPAGLPLMVAGLAAFAWLRRRA
ncbi:MAG: VPLPA-CTERM sorting domain-containing protein [Pseudomonadota bacterium]